MSDTSDAGIDREVIREALELMDKHAQSELWLDADDQMAADYSLAAKLLRGELEGKHVPAAKHVSEVLPKDE